MDQTDNSELGVDIELGVDVGVGGVYDEINIVVVNLKDGEETIIVNKLNELLD